MKEKDKTQLEILAQDMGVAGVLEALAEYCDRSADLVAEANEGKAPAPLEIEPPCVVEKDLGCSERGGREEVLTRWRRARRSCDSRGGLRAAC